MVVLGITGGVGSGKSAAIKHLSMWPHVYVCEADKIGHQLQRKGCSCYQEIVRAFTSEILDEKEEIDRKKLGEIVFADEEKLDVLNGIMRTQIKARIKEEILFQEEKGIQLFVLEAALFFEDSYEKMCDEVWFIYSKSNMRESRLKETRNYSREKYKQIKHNQMSSKEYRKRANRQIDNTKDKETLFAKLDEEIKKLMEKKHEVM